MTVLDSVTVNDPNSELGVQLAQVVIGRDVAEQGRKLVEVQPRYMDLIRGSSADGRALTPEFSNAAEIRVAEAVMDVIRDFGIRAAHGTDEKVLRVLLYSRSAIVSLVRDQLDRHYEVRATRYESSVPRGFEHLEVQVATVPESEQARDVRQPVPNPSQIRSMLFCGLKRSLYAVQRFQSDGERQFAVLLEDAPGVLKWAKPKDGALKITWTPDGRRDERRYNPDFVVEAADRCFLVEVKDAAILEDPEVMAKMRSAVEWCGHASDHARTSHGKPWSYLLVPHDRTGPGATFAGIVAAYQQPAGR